MGDIRKNPFYNNPCLWMNALCSLAGALIVGFIWFLMENWLLTFWHFGDRFSSHRIFFITIVVYVFFYYVGLFLFHRDIQQSTITQKMVVYGVAFFYIVIGALVVFVVKKEMLDTYAYIDSLQILKDKEILSFTTSYKDRQLLQRTIHVNDPSSTLRLKNALLNADAYSPNHDQWLLEGILKVQLKDESQLVFDWYVPRREPESVVLKPNSNIYVIIDKKWFHEKENSVVIE